MGSNLTVAENPQTELRVQSNFPQRDEYPSENELEDRIKNLSRLVDSLHATPDQMSFSAKPRALDLVTDLRVKIKASHNLLRVAKAPQRSSAQKHVFEDTRFPE